MTLHKLYGVWLAFQEALLMRQGKVEPEPSPRKLAFQRIKPRSELLGARQADSFGRTFR